MDRNKDHVAAGVHEFDDLMDTAFVVFHLDEAAEDTDAMVDMDDVVAHVEGGKVVEGQLFGLFDAAAEADPVEAVEDFMVRIVADAPVVVDEALMEVLPLDEARKDGVLFLEHDGTEPFELGFLFAVYQDLVSCFHPAPDVGKEQVEVLVEDRLGGDMEVDCLYFPAEWRLQMDPAEGLQQGEKLPVLVHVGGIEPERGILGEEADQADFSRPPGDNIRINQGLVHLFDGQLGVAVEGVDPVHFVAEEGEAVGMFPGIGEDVDDGAADGELAGRGHEVHPFKAFGEEFFLELFERQVIAGVDGQKRFPD